MARGPKKHLKRLNAPKTWMLPKLGGVWAPRSSLGAHPLRESLPLILLVRNRLKYALTAREVKFIVRGRMIQIDGKIRTDTTYPAGFMDVVTIKKTNENFRLLYDPKGRFHIQRINASESRYKLCKVVKRFKTHGGIPHITTNDCRTIRYPDPLAKVHDTIKLDLKTNKITDVVKFELGNLAMVVGGGNALKFIAQVIVPPKEEGGLDGRHYGHASPILPQAFEQNQYIARDDFLLNRPWVLYVSALVVWCYGFALEGPITPIPHHDDFDTYSKKEQDMMSYLDRVAGVHAPDDLEAVQGKNRCLGLLMILKDSFGSTRWELTHEAAGLLGNACLKLKGIEDDEGDGVGFVGELGGKEGWDAAVREGRPGEMTVANAAKVGEMPMARSS